METLSVYRNTAIKKGLWSIRDKKENYHRILDKAITRFNEELAAIEQRCLDSKENAEVLYRSVLKSLTDMHHTCEEFERSVSYDKTITKDAQARFREKTEFIMSKSYFINRARTWPQGYQGDHKTLEFIYRTTPQSEGIGYYLDLYALNVALATGVRNRIKKLENILREEIIIRETPSILNVACGSCRELVGLSADIISSKAKVICMDNDNDALNFAQGRLSYTGALPQIEFRKYNALRMFDHELNMMEFGMQDIIYSMGYFDYLTDDFLVKMLRSLYMLLNPGGKLIMPFKDAAKYKPQDYHWLCDWDGFLQRTEDDFDRILEKAGIPDSALSQSRDKSGVIIFYTATK